MTKVGVLPFTPVKHFLFHNKVFVVQYRCMNEYKTMSILIAHGVAKELLLLLGDAIHHWENQAIFSSIVCKSF